MALSRPELLAGHHDLENFASGESSLDDWLRRRARTNQLSGASRTYVVAEDGRVVGYYALASGAVATDAVTGRFRRNMPDPVPVVIQGRLAIDRAWQGRGLGRGLFRDAAQRVVQAADTIGIRGILVHAISEQARNFYLALGFEQCPSQPMMLVVTLTDLRASLA